MRGVRFTKAEVSLLELILAPDANLSGLVLTPLQRRSASFIHTKLQDAQEATINPSIQPIERSLICGGKHKVIPLITGHARASKQAGECMVTAEQAQLVGEWMFNQQWIKGTSTIIDVLNKWHQWYPKAVAWQEETKRGVKPGLGLSNVDTGPSTNKSGQGIKVGHTAQGFR